MAQAKRKKSGPLEQETKALALQDANSGHLSPVPIAETDAFAKELGYDKMDATGTKHEYLKLKAELDQHGERVAQCIVILDEAAACYRKMQALLSQRGADRKKVLKEAGCPTWASVADEFAKKVGYSPRHLRRKANELCGTPEGNKKDSTPRWNKAAQRAAVEGCETLNDIVMEYEAGKDIRPLIDKAKEVMSRERLDHIVNANGTQPDYKRMLIRLIDAIFDKPIGDARLWERVRQMAESMQKAITPAAPGEDADQQDPAEAAKPLSPVLLGKQNAEPKSEPRGPERARPGCANLAERWYSVPRTKKMIDGEKICDWLVFERGSESAARPVAVGTSQAETEAIINKLVAGAGTPAAVTPSYQELTSCKRPPLSV